MIKTAELTRGNITNIVGAVANDYEGQRAIVPQWKRGMSNVTTSSSSGDYDGGDRVIGFMSYEVDGDILITTGWGDGIAYRRLNDDGTLTKLWHENYGLYRDDTNTYNHLHCVAIHKQTSQAAFMTHNVNGYSLMDYSDLKAGGTTVVNERPPSRYIFSTGANVDRSGVYYTNGLVTAGDWLYVGDYDASHYKKVPRRHWVTGEEQLLDGTGPDVYPGAANVDRNGYRYTLYYDEVNDRVYYNSYYNGNFMLVVDASTADPKIVWCDMGDIGLGDDGYEDGLFVPDPVNQPNRIVMGCNSRNAFIDITPCFTGSSATIIKQFYTESHPARFGNLHRAGTKYQSINSEHCDKHPLYPELCPCPSDRGRQMLDGWLDWDNSKIVGLYRHNNTTEDTTSNGRGRSYRSDYSCPIFRMRSANGTPWWIKVGYGYDGHSFKIWDDSIGPGLVGNWEIEYGTYTLDNNSNIDFVRLSVEDHYIPSNCSLSYYVSNNNGSTWELYNVTGDNHYMFTSSGYQLKIKYVANGQEDKAPYKLASAFDNVTYGTLYESVKDVTIPYKVSRKRIRGKK